MPSSKPCKSGQVRYDNRCRTFDKDELYKMSPTELRSIAKKLEIPKYSLMNTSKLMKEIYLYKYDCKPPKVWDTTDRSSPKCRDRRKSPKDKGYSESRRKCSPPSVYDEDSHSCRARKPNSRDKGYSEARRKCSSPSVYDEDSHSCRARKPNSKGKGYSETRRKCSPPSVYDQEDHTCRARRTSPRNKGYAQAQRLCKPPMVWDRETHECRVRKFKASMKEKQMSIEQDTMKLKGTVKKIYQLSSAIDLTKNKEVKAKLERARNVERFNAEQEASVLQFEKDKVELKKKDFDATRQQLQKNLTSDTLSRQQRTKREIAKREELEKQREQIRSKLTLRGVDAQGEREIEAQSKRELDAQAQLEIEAKREFEAKAKRVIEFEREKQRALEELDKQIKTIQATTEAKIKAAGDSLSEIVEKQSFITRQGGQRSAFYKSSVLPVEVRFRMENAIRGCQTAFLESQMADFEEFDSGLKEFTTLVLKHLNECRQLYEGKLSQMIADARAELEQNDDPATKKLAAAGVAALLGSSALTSTMATQDQNTQEQLELGGGAGSTLIPPGYDFGDLSIGGGGIDLSGDYLQPQIGGGGAVDSEWVPDAYYGAGGGYFPMAGYGAGGYGGGYLPMGGGGSILPTGGGYLGIGMSPRRRRK